MKLSYSLFIGLVLINNLIAEEQFLFDEFCESSETISFPNSILKYPRVPLSHIRKNTNASTPIIAQVVPTSGSIKGGEVMDISGDGFDKVVIVHFGTIPTTNFTIITNRFMRVVIPPTTDPLLFVDITVSTPENTSPIIQPNDLFMYLSH